MYQTTPSSPYNQYSHPHSPPGYYPSSYYQPSMIYPYQHYQIIPFPPQLFYPPPQPGYISIPPPHPNLNLPPPPLPPPPAALPLPPPSQAPAVYPLYYLPSYQPSPQLPPPPPPQLPLPPPPPPMNQTYLASSPIYLPITPIQSNENPTIHFWKQYYQEHPWWGDESLNSDYSDSASEMDPFKHNDSFSKRPEKRKSEIDSINNLKPTDEGYIAPEKLSRMSAAQIARRDSTISIKLQKQNNKKNNIETTEEYLSPQELSQ